MSDSRFWVRRYMAEGLSVIPIPPKEKGPRVPNWQATSFAEEDFGPNDNIGVRLGEPSGGLVDIDLDAKEAIIAARTLLLQSQRVHGRAEQAGFSLLVPLSRREVSTLRGTERRCARGDPLDGRANRVAAERASFG